MREDLIPMADLIPMVDPMPMVDGSQYSLFLHH